MTTILKTYGVTADDEKLDWAVLNGDIESVTAEQQDRLDKLTAMREEYPLPQMAVFLVLSNDEHHPWFPERYGLEMSGNKLTLIRKVDGHRFTATFRADDPADEYED
jgi:hypothetical protein